MFSTFLQTISGYFNKRFILSAFFPTLAFGGLSLLVVVGLHGTQTTVDAWNAQPEGSRTFLVVAFLAMLLFLAFLLEAFSIGLTRLYEGYWRGIPLLGWWGKRRRRSYHRRWDRLSEEMKCLSQQIKSLEREIPPGETEAQRRTRRAQIDELYAELGEREREWFLFYPSKRALVMPTRLGNILRAAELHPLYRYNLDAVVIWPRLQSVLPEAFASSLQDAKARLDLLLNLTTLAVLFTLGWEIYLGPWAHRWDWFLIVGSGWIMAFLAYQAALHAGRAYGELIKTAYDLHRWELLSALHLSKPRTYPQERELWGDVTDLLYRNYPPNTSAFRYETAGESPDPPGSGAESNEGSDRTASLARLARYLRSIWAGGS